MDQLSVRPEQRPKAQPPAIAVERRFNENRKSHDMLQNLLRAHSKG